MLRGDKLVVAIGAVTAVPLGEKVEAKLSWDVVRRAEAIFRERDPEFDLCDVPVEIAIGDHRRLFYGGRVRLEPYEVFVARAFCNTTDGTDECAALSLIGACPASAANCSALLLWACNIELTP